MRASIFFAISDRQKSLRSPGFPRVSNCHCTRKGLAEYPDAPTTQTISPFQSIRIRLTFCSASHDSTSKETLPLPSKRIIRSGSARREGKINGLPSLRIVRKAVLNSQRAILNSQCHAVSRKGQCGSRLGSFRASRRRLFSASPPHVGAGRPGNIVFLQFHFVCRRLCELQAHSQFDYLRRLFGFHGWNRSGLLCDLIDNRIQFMLPAFQSNFVGESQLYSLWTENL